MSLGLLTDAMAGWLGSSLGLSRLADDSSNTLSV